MQRGAIILAGVLWATPARDDPPAASQEAFARAFSLACDRGAPEELAALVGANPRWVIPHFEELLNSWLRRSSELDERAEAALLQARILAETVADSQDVYGLLEILESAEGLPEEALGSLTQAREDYRSGSQAATRQDFAMALSLLEGPGAVFDEFHFWKDAARCHQLRGHALSSLDRAEEACREFRRALELNESVWDLKSAATSADNLAVCEEERGNYRSAIGCAERSVACSEKVRDQAGLSKGLGISADAWLGLGNPERALELAERALVVAEDLDDALLEAAALGTMGSCHAALSDHRAALDCDRRELVLAEHLGDRDLTAGCLTNIGLSLMQLGQPRPALDALEQSLQIQREHGISRHLSQTLECLGMCWRRLDDDERARDYFEQALVIYRKSGSRPREAVTLGNLGVLFYLKRDMTRALEYELAGLTLLDQAGVGGRSRCNALYRIGLCKLNLHDARGALAAFEEFGAALDHVPRTHLSEADRMQFVLPWTDLPGEVSRLALELQRSTSDPAAPDRVFPLLERLRGRTLLEGLTERAETALATRSPELGARRREVVAELEARRVELARNSEAGVSPEELAPLRDGIGVLEEQLTENERELRRSDPRLAELVLPSEVPLARVQAAVPKGAGLLLFVLEDASAYVWEISGESVAVVELAAGTTIRTATSRLLENLRRPAAAFDFVAPARELYQLLLAPVEPFLRDHRRLILVPDGVLSFLPFEVLLTHDPDASEARSLGALPYLLRDFTVEYSPSASLRAFEDGLEEPDVWKKETLLVGDPVLEEVLAGSGDQSRWRASLGALRFERLHKTRDEVVGIAYSLLAPGESDVAAALERLGRSGHVSGRRFDLLVGAEASAAALGGDLRGYRILHVATHGFFDAEFPWFSGLILSGASGATGFLSTMDIGTLQLDAQIVFLSACDTALGPNVKGEGIQNLARAFLLAGADSVVATAWSVRDDVAPIVAQAFYAEVMEGKDAATALRAAKLRLLDMTSREPRKGARGAEVVDTALPGATEPAHPSSWAPFVLWSRGGRSGKSR